MLCHLYRVEEYYTTARGGENNIFQFTMSFHNTIINNDGNFSSSFQNTKNSLRFRWKLTVTGSILLLVRILFIIKLIDVKNSIEFSHAEVKELKEVEKVKRSDDENKEKIHALEEANQHLLDTVIDLKARSMRDNLLFHNVPEDEKENTSDKIYKIFEENLQISDARAKIKIDRSHRVGRKRDSNRKLRAIVVKFNYFQDREHIRMNARKHRGTISRGNRKNKANLVSRNEEGESARAQSAYGSRQVVYKQCRVQTLNIILYIVLV